MFYVIINKDGLYFDFLSNGWIKDLNLATTFHANEGEDLTKKEFSFLEKGKYQVVEHPLSKELNCL